MSYLANRRVHVGPHDFGNGAATDYWINFTGTANQVAAAGATNPAGMSGWQHTTTSLVATPGAAGDLNDVTDYTPSHILTDASGDAFVTPRIFGGYDQFQRAADVLGYLPTTLRVDAFAAFTVTGGVENSTFFGLTLPANVSTASATISCSANQYFFTTSSSSSGIAADTGWHRWRIACGPSTSEWFSDTAVPGTLASHGTMPTYTDAWPLSFKLIAGPTNRIAMSWVHIGYY